MTTAEKEPYEPPPRLPRRTVNAVQIYKRGTHWYRRRFDNRGTTYTQDFDDFDAAIQDAVTTGAVHHGHRELRRR